jgi:hypothetical protein
MISCRAPIVDNFLAQPLTYRKRAYREGSYQA